MKVCTLETAAAENFEFGEAASWWIESIRRDRFANWRTTKAF